MNAEGHPHGKCCACEKEPGPAAYAVLRSGKQVDVCTRCVVSTDRMLLILTSPFDNPDPYAKHDPAGAFVLAMAMLANRLAELAEPSTGGSNEARN